MIKPDWMEIYFTDRFNNWSLALGKTGAEAGSARRLMYLLYALDVSVVMVEYDDYG